MPSENQRFMDDVRARVEERGGPSKVAMATAWIVLTSVSVVVVMLTVKLGLVLFT